MVRKRAHRKGSIGIIQGCREHGNIEDKRYKERVQMVKITSILKVTEGLKDIMILRVKASRELKVLRDMKFQGHKKCRVMITEGLMRNSSIIIYLYSLSVITKF